MKLLRRRARKQKSQRGIALFMVMGSITLLTVLLTELTYSTQINSRLAYNYVDGLKAYYLAKAGFKLSLIRLKAYVQVKNFVDEPANKQIKDSLPKGTLDKIWSMPLLFPLPVPKDATVAEGDAVKEFMKESKLVGNFTAVVTGESAKLNLNLLFIKEAKPEEATGASGTSGASGASGSSAAPPPAQTTGASGIPVDFRKVLSPAIDSLLEQKKNADREFADIYRNVQGKDIIDALEYYMFPDRPASNLPGFKVFKPKLGPLYSMSELHLIPGIDDELYKLLEGSFTVYSTPGINMNTMTKRTLLNLIPEMTDPESDDVLRKRDDPDVGQPWATEDEFWQAVGTTSAGKTLDPIKKRLKDANLKFIPDEQSFKVSVLANVGQSTRRLEAYVVLDPKAAKQQTPAAGQPGQAGQPPPSAQGGHPFPPGQAQQEASAKKPTGVNLIYWRML